VCACHRVSVCTYDSNSVCVIPSGTYECEVVAECSWTFLQ
jgi:hypothetical protein